MRRPRAVQSSVILLIAILLAVPFHTVLFPAYLIGTNDSWTMLNSISTTGEPSAGRLGEDSFR